MVGVKQNKVDVVELLLKGGASIDVSDSDNCTLVHWFDTCNVCFVIIWRTISVFETFTIYNLLFTYNCTLFCFKEYLFFL